MKIAVISDIHANELAFSEILKDIEEYNPDMVFCLGDLILAGYKPNYVCKKILELKRKYQDNFKIIQGNTDKMLANPSEALLAKLKDAYPCMGYALEEDLKITRKDYIDFIKDLPERMIVEVNGLKIELCHGSPRNQSENINPNMKDSEVEEMVKDSEADLILCGHTHIPCGYSLNCSKTVINAGSVGRSLTHDRKPVYLQLEVDENGKFTAEHKSIYCDNNEVIMHILARDFNHCEDLAGMFVENKI